MKAYDFCRRVAALLLALALLTGILSGCGEEEQIEQITLRTISVMGDDGIKDAYTGLLERYSAEYPHVYHIGTVAQSSNAYKLDALFEDTYTASRYPHAVYYYTNTGMDDLREHFVSVEEIRESYPDFASDITEAALDSVRSDDGKAYCVPFAGSWTALAVNKSILNRFDLQIPENWQRLMTVCGVLSARGITPIANTPGDSAALLELMCVGGGAKHALDSAIKSSDPLPLRVDREVLTEIFRRYQELCGIYSFPQAVVTDELARAMELVPGIGGAVSSGDASQAEVSEDPVDLFNAGEAAMVILDSSQYERITLNNWSLVMLPSCDVSGESPQVMVGGFETGWYITRRAFRDNTVRDAVVAFVDTMTDSAAAVEFARMGYLPSAQVGSVSDGDVSMLSGLAGEAGEYIPSLINPVNSSRFARLELIASAISLKLITPEQAVELASDPSLKLVGLLGQPEPEENVSGSDAVPALTGGDLPEGGQES